MTFSIKLKNNKEDINLKSLDDVLKYNKEDVIELCIIGRELTDVPEFIRQLTNLEYIDLSDNQLICLPEWIRHLTNLEYLNLRWNKLKSLPESMGKLKNLKFLIFRNNKLKSLPESFRQLTNLESIDLHNNKFTSLPDCITQLTDLRELNLRRNKLESLPESIGQLTKIEGLNLRCNRLTSLPESIGQLKNLKSIIIRCNRLTSLPESFRQLTDLEYLNLRRNKLTYLPESFDQLINLRNLDIGENNLTSLPGSIINLRNLKILSCEGNPINYCPPHINRFLDRLKNVNKGIYDDSQSVHNHSIQESVRKSIHNIMSINLNIDENKVMNDIIKNETLTEKTKRLLFEYSEDNEQHSVLLITFKELLLQIYAYIKKYLQKDKETILNILNEEINDSECKCYTGRMSRLINCLNGFTDKVEIKIANNEQIGNVILMLKEKHEDEPKLKEIIEKELLDRGYNKEIVEEWIEYVE